MPGWSTFQSAVAPYLDNPVDGKTHAETAEKIASEYHKAVSAAQTTFHGTILTTQPPYAPLKMAIEDALNQISESEGAPQLQHFTKWSAATVAYWASTQYALLPFHPLAMIASTGTVGIPIPISNIAISGGTPSPLDAGLLAAFTHPAVNSPMGDTVCGKLILAWTAHLTTVIGIHLHTVIGGTPATPTTPIVLPVPWMGLMVQPATPAVPKPDTPEIPAVVTPEMLEEATTLTPAQDARGEDATDGGYGISQSTAIGLGAGMGGGAVSENPNSPTVAPTGPSTNENIPPATPCVGDAPLLGKKTLRKSWFRKKKAPKKDQAKQMDCISPVSNPKVAKNGVPQSIIVAMKKYGITAPIQRAHFLAQCSHESGGFKWVTEFASGAAYEGRKDLGNTQSGDGRRFKGRGFIQLTGRNNYTKFNKGVSKDVINNPALCATDFVAETACWYWKTRKLNRYAIDGTYHSLLQCSYRVNGGWNGYEDRKRYFSGYWAVLQDNPNAYT